MSNFKLSLIKINIFYFYIRRNFNSKLSDDQEAENRGLKRQFSASVMSPSRKSPSSQESNIRRTYSVLSNAKKVKKQVTRVYHVVTMVTS